MISPLGGSSYPFMTPLPASARSNSDLSTSMNNLASAFSTPSSPGTGSTDATLQQMMSSLSQLLSMLGQMGQSSTMASQAMGGRPNFGLTTPTASPSPAANNSNANLSAAPQQANSQNNNGRLRVAVIDDFTSDHGPEMVNIIRNGGGDRSLAGRIDTLEISAGSNGSNIANSLRSLIQRVQSGEQIDAVNLSQQQLQAGGNAGEIRQLIDQLGSLGIPVSVAAGNGGTNVLAGNLSFNVQSNSPDSGRGNVQGMGNTTSRAAANLAPILAARKAAGQSLSQIRSSL